MLHDRVEKMLSIIKRWSVVFVRVVRVVPRRRRRPPPDVATFRHRGRRSPLMNIYLRIGTALVLAMSFAASPNAGRDAARAKALASLPADSPSLALMAITKGMGAGPLRKALGDETLRAKLNDPVAETERGDTLLTLAARHGSTEAIRLLLQEGAAINQVNAADGASALAVAIQSGHSNMVRVLLELKADASQPAADGRTPLLLAVPQGSAEVVRLLLGACSDKAKAADHATPQSGVTALHKAAFLGHDETVRHLLKAGARPEVTDAEGVTPLLLACRNGHASVARALLKAGSAAVGVCTNQGGATPLHFAAKLGSTECCQMLIASKANVNAPATNDVTPLHLAAQAGRLKAAKLLLEANANVDAVDKDGAPPLFYADVQGHMETCKLLGNYGASRDPLGPQSQERATGGWW